MRERTFIILLICVFVFSSCSRSQPNALSQVPSSSASSAPTNLPESSRTVGTVNIPLAIVDNKSYSYQTPQGESGSTNRITIVTLADGQEVQALPYVNYKTADGAFHSELTTKGERVYLESPLANTELWRMVGLMENSK